MALPRISLRGRTIILLNGYHCEAENDDADRTVVVDDEDKLERAALRNPDAVAFGYVAGEWVAGA